MRSPIRSAALSAVAVGALAAAAILPALPAQADISPSSSSTPATVGSQSLATAQLTGTGAIGWVNAVSGGTVYVGGSFSGARPAGATSGSSTRGNVMAYSLTTGALSSFAPITNGQVRAMAVSPDGATLYIGGDFTTVNGTTRNHLAAVSIASGALTSWNPNANASIRVLQATAGTVYIGGQFSTIGSVSRKYAGAVDASTGAATAWAPTVNGYVQSMAVNGSAGKVALGGFFSSLNGQSGAGFGIVDATAGSTTYSTPIRALVTDGSSTSAIWGMSSDGTNVYGSGYYSQQDPLKTGNLEGTFAVNWSSGATVWLQDCHGDEYSNVATNGVVYVLGHPHYCGDVPGGYPQSGQQNAQRAVAFTTAATGTLTQNTLLQPRYYDFTGQAAPSQLAWYPTLAPGTASGSAQAAWFVSAGSGYVVMTGEFPTVNGGVQYGNARFAVNTVAKSSDGPQLSGSAFPVDVNTLAAGTARITWLANNDHDDEQLTYTLYRGNTAIFTTTADSRLWFERPTLAYTDTGVTVGGTYSYHVVATDSNGNTATGGTTSYTVPATTGSAYARQVVSDGATSLWRLGSGSTASNVPDTAGALPATAFGGVSFGEPGAIADDGNTAASFDGAAGTTIASNQYQYATDTFSVEAWFKSTSSTGGEIIGGGDQQTQTTTTRTDPTGQTQSFTSDSSNHDREISTTSDGHVTFTVDPGATQVVTSTKAGYNDGKWHQVVGSLSSAGQVLYIDGARVGSLASSTRAVANEEYWRIGGDSGYVVPDPDQQGPPPASPNYFSGSVDEPAVYVGRTLTAAQVADHYSLATGTTGSTNAPPTASYTATVSGTTAAFDASASTDSDGSIASYAWTYGDGTTGSGRASSHSYTSSGTFQTTLTVVDDGGASASVSKTITIGTATNTIAADAFSRTSNSGLGSADTGGAYTVNSSSKITVANGAAQLAATKGSTLTAQLPSTSSTSTDLTATASLSAVPSGGSVFWSLVGRSVGGSDYRARVQIAAGGQVSLVAMRGATALQTVSVPGLVYAAGDVLQARVQVSGTSPTTIRARVWKVGTSEPTTWQVSTTDSTAAQQAAGSVGFEAYLGSGSTVSPLTVRVDDLVAKRAG